MSENVYTTVASSMVAHTGILTARLAPFAIGAQRRVLSVTPPAGPSSADGTLSRQSMVLASETEQVMCGWVDFVEGSAEVRDWGSVKRAYEARFKTPFDVREDEYRTFLQKVLEVLRELKVRVEVTGDAAAAYATTDPATLVDGRIQLVTVPADRPSKGVLGTFVLAIGVLLFVVMTVAYFLFI